MKTNAWQRIFPVLVFALWTIAFGRLLYHQSYQTYLMEGFFPLMVAGVVLSGLFAGVLWHKPIQGEMRFWSGMVLLVPLLFMLGNQEQSLGSYALEKRLVEIEAVEAGLLQITPTPVTLPSGYGELESDMRVSVDQVHSITLMELVNFSERYLDREIVVQGMVHQGARVAQNQLLVFRFVVSCCVADAKPLAFAVYTDEPQALENDEWVEINGVFSLEDKPGIKRYKITAKTIKKIETPTINAQYLYVY